MPNSGGAGAATRIVLQGGGRMEHVAQILDVRLEPDPLHCTPDGPGRLLVAGGIRAYLYCRTTRGREVEGQGVYIPFSTRLAVTDAARAKVEIAGLRSQYDYDPVTGDFQHQIFVDLSVQEASEEAPDASVRAEVQFTSRIQPDLVERSEQRERPGESEAPEKGGSQTKVQENLSTRMDDRTPAAGAGREEAHRPAPPVREERRIEGRQDGEERDEREENRSGAIVWKPFPPPIA